MEWTDYPRVALALLLVLTNVGLFAAMSTSGVAYGPYNSEWDGGASVRQEVSTAGATPELVRTTGAYVEAETDSVGFVVSPTRSYEPRDVARIRQFVTRGGTLVVAGEAVNESAERSATNDLLAGLDVRTRLNGTTVRDAQNNYRNGSLPRATNVSDHPLVDGVDRLTLNYGTVLDVPDEQAVGREARPAVLVSTAQSSYLDDNDDGELNDTEPLGSFPVAVAEPVGDGRVVVVSDASVFTNAMLEQDGNAAFARALSANATTAMLDYSHRPPLAPLTYSLLVVRSTPIVQVALAALSLALVALWARWPATTASTVVRRRLERGQHSTERTLDEDDVVAFVRDRHPEWDTERVRRVSQHIIRRREDQ